MQGVLDFWVIIVIIIWVCIHKLRKLQRMGSYQKLGKIAEDYAKSENPEWEPKAYYVNTSHRFLLWGNYRVVLHHGQEWDSYWVDIEPKNLNAISIEPYGLCILPGNNIDETK